ncbi:MAG: hypothetical protein AB7K24_34605 [Gemmataceae bacterium]
MHEHPTLHELANDLALSAAARSALQPDLSRRAFLDRLNELGLHADALQLLPHLLERRRAVWWACLCCWDAYRDRLVPALEEALTLVLRWVDEPSEDTRCACDLGADVVLNSAANCLRMAVCWSGGSMLPVDLPEVVPPPQVTAQLSTAAVLIAAASRGVVELADKHKLYLSLGIDVLEGELLWPAASAVVSTVA